MVSGSGAAVAARVTTRMFETAPVSLSHASTAPPDSSPSGIDSVPPIPTPAEPVPDAIAPADMAPRPRWWERSAWYVGSMLLTCVLVFFGLRLDKADPRAPFYYDLDSLLIMPMVKATAERGPGGHWHNERMGAGVSRPDSQQMMDLYDFPVIDLLHFLLIWILSKVISHIVVLYNTYFLLTFPLTTLTAMIAFRHLRLTLPAAAVGGMLYSFLPFHYQRWENHYFLAAYWLVPIALLPVFAICRGTFPFFQRQPDGTYSRRFRSWKSLGYVSLGIAVASAGAYYAFFTCAIMAFAGAYAWAVFRTWRAAAAAGGLIAVVVLVGILHHIPSFRYQWDNGRNPVTDRFPEEADAYGMKLAHLVLPIPDHNLTMLANVRLRYFSPNRPSEGENAGSLGVIGTAGLLALVIMVLLPFRRGWPYGPLAGLTLFTVLLSTIGGFGSVFNLIVSPEIRAYNRSSVFVAFFCLFAALWPVDRFLLTRSGPRASRIRYAAWGAVFFVGFFDQTPHAWFRSKIVRTIDEQAIRFRDDGQFFAEIERAMPAGSKVFCLPYAPFPEHVPIEKMPVYEHSRGYIHTNTLVWSFGAMKGREADAWHYDVAFDKPDDVIRRIVFGGFDGVLIDCRGYPNTKDGNRGALLAAQFKQAYSSLAEILLNQKNARLPEIARPPDGQQLFLDLRPYRDLLQKKDPMLFAAGVKREQDWVALLWLDGFYCPEGPPNYNLLRYGPPHCTAVFVNPSDRTRYFKLTMQFGTDARGPFTVKLSGLVNEEFELDKEPTSWGPPVSRSGLGKQYVVEVPPGRHSIRFRCKPPSHFAPSDYRNLCFFIMQFNREEVFK
jgi:hypothetical protein